jgi:single-stranded-DNA-specific exonuclease
MKKKWVIKDVDNVKIPNMPEYPGLVARLLALRGITEPQAVEEYLNPEYSRLFDPFIFKDMQKACDRIWQAINESQKIFIYADYDADAITASSVMTLALKKLGGQVDCYIPDRFTEGYGMNLDAIRKVKQQGGSLVITVDCGTNSVTEAELCKELGLDLIITDHHEITGDLPDAYALINPKNTQDSYPFRYLTGVGVAYKVVQALFSEKQKSQTLKPEDIPDGWEKWLLDLVAIGTVADLQALQSENRIMVAFGLQVLRKTRWPGLRALMDVCKLQADKCSTHTLGFILAPRINAAGRIKHADAAYKLLISEDASEAQKLAMDLDQLNSHRQMLTEQILSEAREQVMLVSERKVLLAAGKDWPKGIVGLVAGRLAEEFNKPVLIMDRGETYATGSARSHPKFDIVKALTHSRDLLEKYGGHTQAAGFTLLSSNIESLYQKLLEFAETLNDEYSEPVLEADAEMKSADMNWDVYEQLEKFEPFGYGNPRPKFIGRGMQVIEARTVGGEAKHLKLKLLWDGRVVDAIAFRFGYLITQLKPNQPLDAVFEMESNEWGGHKDLQMKIIDLNLGEAK